MDNPASILTPAIPVTAGIATASKPFRDGKGRFLKWSPNGNPAKVLREWSFLVAMANTGVTPKPISHGADFLLMEDLGDPVSVPDDEMADLERCGARLLASLYRAQIWHNDLRPQNLIYRGGVLYCIDFGRAAWHWEPESPYRPDEDVILLADSISKITKGDVWHA